MFCFNQFSIIPKFSLKLFHFILFFCFVVVHFKFIHTQMVCLCLLCDFMCFHSVCLVRWIRLFLDISIRMMRDRLKNVIYTWPNHEIYNRIHETHAISTNLTDPNIHWIYTCICLFIHTDTHSVYMGIITSFTFFFFHTIHYH